MNAFLTILDFVFDFWPLLLLFPFWSRKSGPRNLVYVWVIWALFRTPVFFTSEPLLSSIFIPEPLNTFLFFIAGAVLFTYLTIRGIRRSEASPSPDFAEPKPGRWSQFKEDWWEMMQPAEQAEPVARPPREKRKAKPAAAKLPKPVPTASSLSPAEAAFHGVLTGAVQDQFHVRTKVKLGDIFSIAASNENTYETYSTRIHQTDIDFLLCHPETQKPILGIELDESGFLPFGRKKDSFLDDVFRIAQFPLLHFQARRKYSLDEITDQINQAIIGGQPAREPVEPSL